jgi:DNA-binding transcriptional MerR regulator
MSDAVYDIQALVELSGVPRRTIYFYTQQAIIPPPIGAGLAARYSDVHLLRLRMIPVLRNQGLRLDDIRRRLDGLDLDDLRHGLDQASPASPVVPLPAPLLQISPRDDHAGCRFIHYALPAGLTLIVPADLQPEIQLRVDQLLLTAHRLLSPKISKDMDTSSGQK